MRLNPVDNLLWNDLPGQGPVCAKLSAYNVFNLFVVGQSAPTEIQFEFRPSEHFISILILPSSLTRPSRITVKLFVTNILLTVGDRFARWSGKEIPQTQTPVVEWSRPYTVRFSLHLLTNRWSWSDINLDVHFLPSTLREVILIPAQTNSTFVMQGVKFVLAPIEPIIHGQLSQSKIS